MVIVLGLLAFAIPLAGYAYLGSFMRYSGDDYCYAAVLAQNGFWKAQWVSYLVQPPYSGNRFALTLFSEIAGLFNPVASGALPVLAILLWLAAMALTLHQLARLFRVSVSWPFTLLLSEFLVFFTFFQAPDLSQVLFWRSGMLPYLAPLVADTFLAALLLYQPQRFKFSPLTLGGTFGLAFLAGGFSETAAAYQAGALLLALAAATLATLTARRPASTRMVPGLLAALLGTGAAMLLLILSPTNAARQADLPAPPDVVNLAAMTLQNTKIIVYTTLRSQWLSNLIAFVFAASISYRLATRLTSSASPNLLRLTLQLALILAIALLLIICSIAPSAYAQSSYPELRALFPAGFTLVAAVAALGWTAGQILFWGVGKPIHRLATPLRVLAPVMLAVCCIFPLAASINIYAQSPLYQKWATLWDARDRQIREASSRNVHDVQVMALDHIIPRVAELQPEAGFWYNRCAAIYYGVATLRANLPGWDQ